MLRQAFSLLLAYLQIVSKPMFKNRFELVKNMMQIMRITLILMCKPSTSSVHFKFGFDFFNILYVCEFLLFSVFFQGEFWGVSS